MQRFLLGLAETSSSRRIALGWRGGVSPSYARALLAIFVPLVGSDGKVEVIALVEAHSIVGCELDFDIAVTRRVAWIDLHPIAKLACTV